MNVLLGYRKDVRGGRPIETYARTFHRELLKRGHSVIPFGRGHKYESLEKIRNTIVGYDYLIELDCGRDQEGRLGFQKPEVKIKVPSAVLLIDSHGYPKLHRRISRHYKHVFFAVWSQRDLFTNHPSAHWCPNATDLSWFGWPNFEGVEIKHDFGFFGSKGGLHRADPLVAACNKNGWTYDVRQIGKAFRHKWPQTGEAMAACRFLFNHGQKHDGPNLRVMESMAMKRPLLTDIDPRDGMSKLFTEGLHYIGYESYTYRDLEEKMKWCVDNPDKAFEIANNAYEVVRDNHTVGHRVEQVLEVEK